MARDLGTAIDQGASLYQIKPKLELIPSFKLPPPPPTPPPPTLGTTYLSQLQTSYLCFYWSECNKNFREGPSKVLEYFQIMIKMITLNQEPPASSKSPNQDLKVIDVLCTFKIKKKPKIWKRGLPKTSDHIQMKIKMRNPSQEPTASSKLK